MDEILEGDVGRTVTFEGKEYWVKEPEPITLEHIKLTTNFSWSYGYRYRYPFLGLTGVMEV